MGIEPTPEEEAEWNERVASRPDVVRVMAERFKPRKQYRLKITGQVGRLYSFSENGTMTVDFEPGLFDFGIGTHVFGLNPDDMELVNDHHSDASRGDSRDAG